MDRKFGIAKICLLTLLSATVAVAAAGCGGKHTHSYSEAWAFDAEAHWHPSTCSHDTKTGKGEHVFTETVIPPTGTSAGYTLHACACGYAYIADEKSPLPPEESGEYRYDGTSHWKPVTEGERDISGHIYRDDTVAPTCYGAGYTKHTCTVCGYWYADAPVDPVAHTVSEGVMAHDETSHWQPCSVCGAKVNVTGHSLREDVTPPSCDKGGYTDFTCEECGYTFRGRETGAQHAYSETFEGNEYEHWRSCKNDGEKTDVGEHVFEGHSNVCAICGKTVTPRISYKLCGEYYAVTGIGSLAGTEVTVPAEYNGKPVKEIAERAFVNEKLTALTLGGSNLEKIGAQAFMGTDIAALTLPSSVQTVGAKAFAGTKIGSLSLGSAVKSLGQGAFEGCASLQTVTIESLTSLPVSAFEGCISLTSVTCTQKLTGIGDLAFNGCTLLDTLDLSGAETLGFSAFGGCAAFAPADLSALTSAGEYALSGTALENAALPAGLAEIPARLFLGCEKLHTVTSSAQTVGKEAFKDCALLSSVTLTGTLSLEESAFAGCTALNTLELPETITHVGENAFTGTGLVKAEGGVNYVGNVAVGLESGTSVSLKETAVVVADGAFRDTKITAVTLGAGVKSIGADAFRGCAISAIDFKNVKTIGANAFRESGLVSVTVPATVDTVGDNAFYDCKSLTAVNVSAKNIGKFAFSYTGTGRTLDSPEKERPDYAHLATLTIGAGVQTIGSNAFQYAPITEVTLPAGLTSIGKYAFAHTDLAGISIPAEVTRIGGYAFYKTQLSTAAFSQAENWTAGGAALSLGDAAGNAAQLKASTIDWVRG